MIRVTHTYYVQHRCGYRITWLVLANVIGFIFFSSPLFLVAQKLNSFYVIVQIFTYVPVCRYHLSNVTKKQIVFYFRMYVVSTLKNVKNGGRC